MVQNVENAKATCLLCPQPLKVVDPDHPLAALVRKAQADSSAPAPPTADGTPAQPSQVEYTADCEYPVSCCMSPLQPLPHSSCAPAWGGGITPRPPLWSGREGPGGHVCPTCGSALLKGRIRQRQKSKQQPTALPKATMTRPLAQDWIEQQRLGSGKTFLC